MEDFPKQTSKFEQLLDEKAKDGWQYVGVEGLTNPKFENGKFIDVPYQSKEDIEKRYSAEGEEVELILAPNEKIEKIKAIHTPEEFAKLKLNDADVAYYVFVREKK